MKNVDFVVAVLISAILSGYYVHQEGHVYCNNEFICVAFKKGEWRSWGMKYSDGRQMQADGKTQTLWRWPKFYHHDLTRRNR